MKKFETIGDVMGLSRVHFIGITGSFNSFAAQYLIGGGIALTASEIDINNENGEYWKALGVLSGPGHSADNITPEIQLVIVPTGAIPDNPEIAKAQELGIPTLTIAQLTGLISQQFKTIPVAGTHGKTTTTAMVTWLLHKLDQTPNFILGAAGDKIFEIEKSFNYNSKSPYLVLEACEYRRQFQDRAPKPYISVVTNIDLDHTDYYRDQADYNDAFTVFLQNTTDAIVIDAQFPNEKDVVSSLLKSSDFADCEIIDTANHSDLLSQITLIGQHNKHNALKAILAVKRLNIAQDGDLIDAINQFPGLAKRFEYVISSAHGNPIYFDYAHNPAKIAACISQAQEQFPGRELIFIWQPHSVERTYTFKDDLIKSVIAADHIMIPDIFSPGRETQQEREMIAPSQFVDEISLQHNSTYYTDGFDNLMSHLAKLEERVGDAVLVFASAGNLHKFVKESLKK